MKTVLIILKNDLNRYFKSKSIILPISLFIIVPTIILIPILLSMSYIIPMGSNSLSESFEQIKNINSVFFFFYYSGLGVLFAIIEGSNFFGPRLKEGTIQLYLILPIRRIELYCSKILEFFVISTVFSLIGTLILNSVISFYLSFTFLPLLLFIPRLLVYLIIGIFLLVAVHSTTSTLNMISSSTVVSLIFSLVLFLLYPFFLFRLVIMGPRLLSWMFAFDPNLYLMTQDLLLFFRLDFYAYSLLYYLLPEMSHIIYDPMLNQNLSIFFYEDFFKAILIIMSFTIIPHCANLLYFSYKDIKD